MTLTDRFLLLLVLVAPRAAAGDVDKRRLPPPAPKQVDFRRDVYPLLAGRCFKCHQGAAARSGVRLDVRAEIVGETTGRPLAASGNSADSRLVHLVSGLLEGEVMPPSRKDRLSAEQVGLLRAWIDQGLAWDDQLLPPPDKGLKHWAFRPVRRSPVPAVRDRGWGRTAVDSFVAAMHEAKGLVPAPEAAHHTLIRRATLDLTGLPPSPEEVEAFVTDPRPDAYERVVERLLASPAYGERWGRHWLDVARHADSEGYENDAFRPFAWRYRDYVVRSFNDDKPFSLFIRQQVAGDELLPASDENLIATGFLAGARYSGNEEDKAIQRNDVLVDVANATASAFLGLTLGCAQCHNHKFDPFTQRDYYRFQGFFVKGQMNNLVLKGPALWREYEAGAPAGYRDARRQRDEVYARAEARLRAKDKPKAPRKQDVERELTPDEKKQYDSLKKQVAELEKKLPPKPQTIGFYSPAGPTPVEVIPLKANYPLPYQPDELRRTKPHLLVRGDVHRRGPEVDVGWPAVFGAAPKEAVGKAPRTALADWLASPDNPLTARVWANRVWQYHFGRGLVETPGDFGVKGAPTTHPRLLDWLASELVRHGWSTRHLHRLLVLSATYRQASAPHAGNAKADPENRYLWRWSPRRLEAEAIRDGVLAVSGELERTGGGPGVPLKPRDQYRDSGPTEETGKALRRSLYLEQRRHFPPPTQALFDAPPANESCARRHVSTVALQPLFLLNSGFMLDRAGAFARRAEARAGADVGRQDHDPFRLALGRPPAAEERAAVATLFAPGGGGEKAASPLVQLCHLLFNLNEFAYLE